ncbi:MAG: transcription termination/antitermination factor NusG [Eggerthellaceae bacterium]|nr:transcription termination/antitermination factor NusG [Eggerthellaceae bacterium]
MTKRWYVLHTYSGYEKKVKTDLESRIENMGLHDVVSEVVVPMEHVVEIKDGGKKKDKDVNVFPGYVLVRMEMDDHAWAIVRNTNGVTGFVGAQGKPAPLTRAEFDKIMKRSGANVPKKTSVALQVDQAVKVISGPLENFEGKVSEVMAEQGKVKVMVSIFGRETSVELSFDQVARIQ